MVRTTWGLVCLCRSDVLIGLVCMNSAISGAGRISAAQGALLRTAGRLSEDNCGNDRPAGQPILRGRSLVKRGRWWVERKCYPRWVMPSVHGVTTTSCCIGAVWGEAQNAGPSPAMQPKQHNIHSIAYMTDTTQRQFMRPNYPRRQCIY